MEIHLVRHAHAGNRSAWRGDDRVRPLSAKGRAQADAIADALERGVPAGAGGSRLLRGNDPEHEALEEGTECGDAVVHATS